MPVLLRDAGAAAAWLAGQHDGDAAGKAAPLELLRRVRGCFRALLRIVVSLCVLCGGWNQEWACCLNSTQRTLHKTHKQKKMCAPYGGADLAWWPVTSEMSNPQYQRRDCAVDVRTKKGAITGFFKPAAKKAAAAAPAAAAIAAATAAAVENEEEDEERGSGKAGGAAAKGHAEHALLTPDKRSAVAQEGGGDDEAAASAAAQGAASSKRVKI
jgi:hypothetical protein